MGTLGTEQVTSEIAVDELRGATETGTLPGEFEAVHYYPDGTVEEESVVLSGLDLAAINLAIEHSDNALNTGNPPVGAVLLVPDPENPGNWVDWGGSAADKTEKDVTGGHAEIKAWRAAQKAGLVGDELQEARAAITVPSCSTCAAALAEAKLGMMIISATRREGWDASGGHTMRQRGYNLHHMLQDGFTDTIVVRGPGREAVLAKYSIWAVQHGYKNAPDINGIPELSLLEDLKLTPEEAIRLRAHIPDEDSIPNN